MLGRKSAILASTALVASLALTACDTTNTPLAPQEFGWLGLPIGQPVEVISATRGDGVSFDSFVITLNEDGSVTVETPEGEEIVFSEDDIEWAGSDPDLGGVDIAKLTSARGDRLDVVIGSVTTPLPPPPDDGIEAKAEAPTTEETDTVALARLDEIDTRDGFETYGVVGVQTATDALPRYQEDVIVEDEGDVLVASGELAWGTAYYNGGFMASVFNEGELLSDDVSGDASVEIDFASNDVWVSLEGDYLYDDVDDVAPGAVIGLNVVTEDRDGITYVTGVEPVYGETEVTDVVVDVTYTTEIVNVHPVEGGSLITIEVVTGVTPVMGEAGGDTVVVNLDVATDSTSDFTYVSGVTAITADENDDWYEVSLWGSGDAGDLGFAGGVQYTGELDGYVEVPVGEGNVNTAGVDGTYAGAVFGPGSGAETVDPANFNDVLDATVTAGVFEANSGMEDGSDPRVQIVGGFIAESSWFNADEYAPAPEPEPEPEPEI